MIGKLLYRFRFLVLLLFSGLLMACSDNSSNATSGTNPPPVEPPAQKVGINVNGQFDVMKFENVKRSGTVWVRGFLDFFQLYPDPNNLDTDKRVQNYLKLKDKGYKTILNIKWNFSNKDFPDSASTEMQNYKSYLKKLLDKVWDKTDIIVIGNEPFIESKKSERDERLVSFYRQIARSIKNYRDNASKEVPIYVGAFNNLYLNSWRTQTVNKLLSFTNSTPWIAGVDTHIHHAVIDQINDFLDYVTLRIRDDQRILVTEFSLKDFFRTKMNDNIPQSFAASYGWDPGTKNYQYLDSTLKNPVSRKQWVDFLSESDWFESHKKYVWNAYQHFKEYKKFHIATYALRQSYPFNKDFTSNTTPWILNGLFANRTVRPDTANGQDQFNYAWIDDFRAIQNDSN